MTRAYCGGLQREERNPNRCWGCGAAMSGHQPKIYVDSTLFQQMQAQQIRAGTIYAAPTYFTAPLGDKIFVGEK